MAAMFGHRWTASFGEQTDPGDVWARCLQGLTPQDIANGLGVVAISGAEWPPTAPQFREMCLNHSIAGLPTADDAYFEIQKFVRGGSRNFQLLSPATYWAWRNLDLWTWRILPSEKSEKVFRASYKQAIEHAKRGGEFPEPPAAAIEGRPTESVARTEESLQRAKETMAEIMRMMGAA
jgi:hypothetical protein